MLARFGAAALAAAVTTLTIPVAHAMDETIVEANVTRTSRSVSYADLDLAKASGVATLHDRVRRAAKGICFDAGDRSLERLMPGIECSRRALQNAQPQIAAAVARAGSSQLASAEPITVAMP